MAEEETSGVTKVLMVVAVLAVITSVIGVFSTLNLKSSGFASSGQGNVTLEIQQVISLNFTNNLINWSSGFVNTSCGTGLYAILDTNNSASPIICGTGWQTQNRGLILTTFGSTLPIAVNLTSNKNASLLLDNGANFGSAFMWKLSEFNITDGSEPSTCDGTLTPTSYTPIQTNQVVRVCNQTQFNPDKDELRIDFQLNVSNNAPAQTGYRTATITATGYLP